MQLGETLKQARQSRGLTVTALASAAGIHKSTLSRWESGKTLPFVQELIRVMDALDFSEAQRRACFRNIEAPRTLAVAPGPTGSMVSSGELLRALRLRARLTQADAARGVGVSQSLITKWERGKCFPGSQHLHQLCYTYRVTLDEMSFLTARSWSHSEALPMDKEALDHIVWRLEHHDTERDRSGTYLALAARYQELYRTGKISAAEANDIYGYYGAYQSWRLGQYHSGQQIAAPAMNMLPKSRGCITSGQLEAVSANLEYYFHHKQHDQAIALLNAIKDREGRHKAWWLDYRALAAEKSGDIDSAARYCQESVAHATHENDDAIRRLRTVSLLCRNERFREALRYLSPCPRSETRPNVLAANLLNHAWVFAGTGDKDDAVVFYSRAGELMRGHDFDDVTELSLRVRHLLV